jgi:tetratricopeptide (TPR) repeat protein
MATDQPVRWEDRLARLEDCRARLQSVERLVGSSPRDALALARALLDDVMALMAVLYLPEEAHAQPDHAAVMRAVKEPTIREHLAAAQNWLEGAETTGTVAVDGIVALRRVVGDLARAVGRTDVTGLDAFRQAFRRVTWLQIGIAAAVVVAVLVAAFELRVSRTRGTANFDVLFAEGGARLGAGDYAAAIERYRRAIDAMPGTERTASAWNDMGWALVKTERYEEAIAAFRKALELKPVFPLARNNLDAAQRQLGLKKSEKARAPAGK